jgi:hypothetical protein
MKRTNLGWTPLLVLVPAVAACSPSSGGGSGSPSGGSSTTGLISFAQGGGPDLDAYTVIALFAEGSGMVGAGSTSPCAAPANGCMYCSSAVDAGSIKPGNLNIMSLGAGTLTFKDDSKTLASLPYSSAVGAYETSSVTQMSLTWPAGDTLSVAATGGAIPAFSASIPAPAAITGVTPALSLEKTLTTSDSGAFVVSWTPAADDGTMTLVLGFDVESHPGTIGCTAPQSDGTITVPASVVKELTGGAAGGGTASLSKTVSKPVSVTGASVKIQASPPQVSGSVMFN